MVKVSIESMTKVQYLNRIIIARASHIYSSYMTLIGAHKMHGQVPNLINAKLMSCNWFVGS